VRWLAFALALALLPARALAGAISGTVVDRTIGRPVGGIEVYLLLPDSKKDPVQTKADAGGRYHFENLPPGEYGVAASHLDVPYVHRGIKLPDTGDVIVNLDVYETTTSPALVTIDADHMLVQREGNLAAITEIVIYTNKGNRTYLGERSPVSPTGYRLAVPVPEGYTALDAPEGIEDRIVNRREGGFDLALPLVPGQTQIVFAYHLPAGFFGVVLDKRFPLPARSMNIVLPVGASWRVRSRDLAPPRVTRAEGHEVLVASGGPFPRGKAFSARVAGGFLGTNIETSRLAWALGGLLIVLLSLIWILRHAGAEHAAQA
jgi:hypothetical protein